MGYFEKLARSNNGVTNAYAIQAGRELRVIVEAERVTDAEADVMSLNIAHKIQTDMTYPGQIKVTVIREKRAVNFAKRDAIYRVSVSMRNACNQCRTPNLKIREAEPRSLIFLQPF